MITGTNAVAEINAAAVAATANPIRVTDEIKRNHLQMPPINQSAVDLKTTELTLKFTRLKKALRKRSSSIL